MAVSKIFADSDATIYSLYPNRNTGLDEIIEVSSQLDTITNVGTSNTQFADASRILMQFSSASIRDIFRDKVGNSSFKVYLRLFLAQADALPTNFKIFCHPISGTWDMGTGRYDNVPETTDGVNWEYQTPSTLWPTGAFAPGSTGSFSGSQGGGGVWYTSSLVSQSFSYTSSKDVLMDVTSIVTSWYSQSIGSGSIKNDGFLLRQENEFITSSIFNFKFFSRDTHTIYPPCLEFRWNDHSFSTGSGTVISNTNVVPTLANNKNEFSNDSVVKFQVKVRDKFPTRVFTTSSLYTNNKLLPSQSYWALKDLHTDETVIDFDPAYTVMSCDGSSSFFTLYMSDLEPERNYSLLFKSVVGSETIVWDENYYFKVKK